MTLHPRSALLVASAALLAACGGRSQLSNSSAASAGSGGAGPTSSSASSGGGVGGGGGGTGGGGALPGSCVLDGKPIGLAGAGPYFTLSPLFVAPTQLDSTTLVAAWIARTAPPDAPYEIRHSTFHAWGAWPADETIGPSYLATYDGSQEFYGSPSNTGFNLLHSRPDFSAGLHYVSQLTPGTGDLGAPEVIDAGVAEAAFLERGADPSVALMGFGHWMFGVNVFNVLRRNDALQTSHLTSNLGCSGTPPKAAAAALGEEFLLAFAANSTFDDPTCGSGGGMLAAQRLIIARVKKDGSIELAQESALTSGDASLTGLKMVPRLDGAWLTWADTVSATLHVARLGANGLFAAGPFEIPFVGGEYSLASTGLGDRLAIARSMSSPDGTAQIRVSVLSAAGNLDAEVAIDAGAYVAGRIALLGSPSNKALLVSWADAAVLGIELRIARLACSLP